MCVSTVLAQWRQGQVIARQEGFYDGGLFHRGDLDKSKEARREHSNMVHM